MAWWVRTLTAEFNMQDSSSNPQHPWLHTHLQIMLVAVEI